MKQILSGKIITVVGASGYIGQNICKRAVQQGAKVNGISRRGSPSGNQKWLKDINWISADANKPQSFASVLNDSDLVIHTIGTLIDTSYTKLASQGAEGTYEHMNRDLLIQVANQLQGNTHTAFVYLSASRGIPFIPRYISTKREAEQYLLNKYKEAQLRATIVQPSFVYSWNDRWWSLPIKYEIDLWRVVYRLGNKVIPQIPILKTIWSELEVDSAINLADVIDSCLINALNNKYEGKCIEGNQINQAANDFRNQQFQ